MDPDVSDLRAPISGSNLPHQSRDDVTEKVLEAYQRRVSIQTRNPRNRQAQNSFTVR